MITVGRLKEILDYDQETGGFRWKVRTSTRIRPGQIAGWDAHHGYRTIFIDKKVYYAHRLAWLYVYGVYPSFEIDHRDGDTGNNAIANLRAAERSTNMGNAKLSKRNSTGFKGVGFLARTGKWRASIATGRKTKHLGYFTTPEAAHAAYVAAAQAQFGEYARTR